MLVARHICAKSLLQFLVCWSLIETTTSQKYSNFNEYESGLGQGSSHDNGDDQYNDAHDSKLEAELHMIPAIQEIELDLNSEFKITCESSDPVKWTFDRSETGLFNENSQRSITISHNRTLKQSILTIHNASASSVGFYGCKHPSLSIYREIYVFVKDFRNELVPYVNPAITESLNGRILIRCRPSFPDVRVELYRMCQKTLTWVRVESYEQKEKEGFFTFGERNDEYMCRAIGKSNNVQTFYVIDDMKLDVLNTEHRKTVIRSLTIENIDGAHIALGKIIRLSCILSFNKNSESQKMRWFLPNNQSVKNGRNPRINVTVLTPSNDYGTYSTKTAILTILNATFQDTGKYKCEAEVKVNDQHKNPSIISNRRTDVTIVHGNESFVDLTGINVLTSSEAPLNSQIMIVVDYLAYPMPMFRWTKDTSEELFRGRKYNFSKNHEIVTLTIKNSWLGDSGNYTLDVEHRNETITQQIYIRGKPVLFMETTSLGLDQQFTCRSNGYPEAKMKFKFVPCQDETFAKCSEASIIPPSSIIKEGPLITKQQFRIPYNKSGYGVCEAKNSEGTANVTSKRLFSDYTPKSITLTREPIDKDIFVTGDTVILFCSASMLFYNKNITFKHNGKEILSNTHDVHNATLWAYQKQLTLDNLLENDNGSIECQASLKSTNEFIKRTMTLVVRKSSPANDEIWNYSGLVVLILLIINCTILVLYCKNKRKIRTLKMIGLSEAQRDSKYMLNPEIFLNDQADFLSYNDEFEFPKQRLKLGKQLGAGHFGVVMEATAYGIMSHEDETTVAVKMIKKRGSIEEMRTLASELKIMIHIGQHLNVVNLLGAVTKNVGKSQLMVIVEYCSYGNVANYLEKHRADFINQIETETGNIAALNFTETDSSSSGARPLDIPIQLAEDGSKTRQKSTTSSITTTDLICWAFQVACGMDYLATKNVLHGDLAARNILLCEGNVVKICDFGLAQSMRNDHKCQKKSDQMLPVKWLALECMESNTFGTPSDVWAYGVMLWEFFTLAKVPYSDIKNPEDLYGMLRDGYRLECPPFANPEIYESMLRCWYVNPDLRPTFKDLSVHFNSKLPDALQDHYIKLNGPYVAMNLKRMGKLEVDDSTHDEVPYGMPPPPPVTIMASEINAQGSTAQQPSIEASTKLYVNYFSFRKSASSTTLNKNLYAYQRGHKSLSKNWF